MAFHRKHLPTLGSCLGAAAALALGGCSVVSPEPVWELTKATAGVARMALSAAPSKSSDTIRHFKGDLASVCIRYNPDTQVSDIVPALQAELRRHQVDSRVYDSPMPAETCAVWLKYAAQIDWDTPPFGSAYKPFVRHAALTLRAADGQLLSSSHYQLGEGLADGKWNTTREKISPVVTALLTGTESGGLTQQPASIRP
ncbi:cell division protein FtsI [Xylophilus rhododendri]|uniref:Cell division protein FtsI n=1 Tax=Xylophilus rhododendri TaxID=2697032 RepID=A0A857JBF4_9BURK|nr:cell division protein FtsI [Xylophilus rhododendri]QHJ00303.1 cell division protein FtsI [Xylophilus rhododendri]